MNSFEEIEKIWKGERKNKLPDAGKIIKLAAQERTTLRNKIFTETTLLFLALITIVYVYFKFHFQYPSTYLGLGLMFITVAIFTSLRLKLSLRLKSIDFGLPPMIIIPQFEQFHLRQKFILTTASAWYVILLNFSFALYFYEVIFHSGLRNMWQWIAIVVYFGWMTISVFIINPKRTKKERERVAGILENLKKSATMLNEDF